MTRTLCRTATPRYRKLFAAPGPDQPLGFFLLENLLTARSGSKFPTNGCGPDEDVNVYLAHLMSRFLRGDHDPQVQFASGALFRPPAKTAQSRRRADFYRANADHRLLYLGLFGRGDGLRRRAVLNGTSAAETRNRDTAAGRACYDAAANILRGRQPGNPALVSVLDKLASHFEDYVYVLSAMATRQLGLGAHLGDDDLARLLPPDTSATADAVKTLLAAPPPAAAVDILLDLWLANGKNPNPSTASRLRNMADQLGVVLPIGTAPVRSTGTKLHDIPE